MKIAFILPGRGRSGGVRCTVAAANKLHERGHAVRILYQRTPLKLRNLARLAAHRMIYPDGVDGLQGFQGETGSFREISQCRFHEKEIIVGVGMWGSAQLAHLGAVANPQLQYIHGPHLGDQQLTQEALSLPLPKVAVSSSLQPLVESFAGGHFLGIVPNGIDQQEYFSAVDESQRDGIGMIYSSHPAKDPQTMLAVIEQLGRLRPDVPVRVFGADKRPAAIHPNFYCRYPAVEKAREIYSKSLVWIIASKWEGFGMPALEAMACNCAVVATDCGGTKDIIVDGQNGFLAEVGNVAQIVERVLLLLDNAAMRNRLRLKAQETVASLSWDKSVDKLEKVLNSLAQ